MGLLDQLGFNDPEKSQMWGLLAQGLAQRNGVAGLLSANQFAAEAPERVRKAKLAEMQMQKYTMDLDKAKRDDAQEIQINDAARSAYRSPVAANAMSMGPLQTGDGTVPTVQPGFDQKGFLSALYGINPMKAIALEQSLAKDNTPIKLGAGESLYDKHTFKPIATAPKEVSLPGAVQEYQFAVGQGYKGTFDEWDRARKRAGATNLSVNTDNLGLKPKDRFEMEGKLADDYMKATEGDRKILGAVSKIKTALDQNGALKDQAAIYAFAKTLDPDGAVREADYAAIANSAGLIDRVRSYTDRLLKGEKLSPAQRQEMLNLGTAWEKVAASRIGPQRSRYTDQAQRYNLNPAAILDPQNNVNNGWSITPIGK